MYGVVSILDAEHSEKIRAIWIQLESECGLAGIRVTPIPHFSWQVAEKYDLLRLEPELRHIAHSIKPFEVVTAGLGIFSGANPVIYIGLVKNEAFMQLHSQIWSRCQATCQGINVYYSPQSWMPHITLAHGDVNREKAGCALSQLVHMSFDWKITIDNIAVIAQAEDEIGYESLHFHLGV